MRSRPLFMPLFAVVVCVLAWPALGEPIPVTPSESDSSARSIVGSILEEPHSQEEGTARPPGTVQGNDQTTDPPQQAGSLETSGSSPCPGCKGEQNGFVKRFFKAYIEEAPSGPELPRRLPPAPFNSPPFPFSDHLGPIIGVPDTTPDYYPLMRALKGTSLGNGLEESRVKIYGWLNPSYNLSTSRQTNIPMTYAIDPNRLHMSQAVLKFERGLDTAQTGHVDWGFRFTNLYGIDYRWTTAKGIFSGQLLDRNQLYGYDPVEFFGQVYVPGVAEGMIVKVGRFISPPDIEAQLSPDNYLASHSVMFAYDPYTFMGVLTTVRLNAQWTIDLGVHGGNDMALWSNSAQPNGHAMVKWVSRDNNDSIWLGANSIGSGKFTNEHDNLQQAVGVWTHKFSDHIHMMTEAYYLWQYDAAKGGSCINGPTKPFASGGGCGPTIPGISDAVGAVNYFQMQLSKADYTTIRNDFLWDKKGQRTGFNTVYGEHTIGWIHWFSNELLMRPEIRYDHSWTNETPYDNGTRKDQFTFMTDVIIRF